MKWIKNVVKVSFRNFSIKEPQKGKGGNGNANLLKGAVGMKIKMG